MLLDPSLHSYIKQIIFNFDAITEDRKRAAKEALIKKNYENICNLKLLEYSNPFENVNVWAHPPTFLYILTIFLLVILGFAIIGLIIFAIVKCIKCSYLVAIIATIQKSCHYF